MQLLENKKIGIGFLLLTLLLLIQYTGCSKNYDNSTNSSNNTPPATNEIFMQNLSFTPADMTINAGTTIKWTNKDGTVHTVTSGTPGSPTGVFDSGNIASNGSFTFTFNQAGMYKYFCKIHTMIGTITVK